MGRGQNCHGKQRTQRTYMYNPWTCKLGGEGGNDGGLGVAGWRGNTGGEIGKTVTLYQ